ncbi:hypothetical protein NDU88_000882 [Pleurodeles waltl]|uniref:Uncharacterized protein n=1 Tax=Pleurodeles waltl TaxID=8319 RepID=A0AAV7TGP7_PLEWA|nr:hypothetical protein NDU88_000882 [Pleurodeles waltl]
MSPRLHNSAPRLGCTAGEQAAAKLDHRGTAPQLCSPSRLRDPAALQKGRAAAKLDHRCRCTLQFCSKTDEAANQPKQPSSGAPCLDTKTSTPDSDRSVLLNQGLLPEVLRAGQ